MARIPKPPLRDRDIQGLKYLRAFQDLLEPLREIPVHGNRQFFMDQYVALLILHFYNPVLSSLRSLEQATGLANVQEALGVGKTSLGAMSESASQVFDPELMVPILETVMARVPALPQDGRLKGLPGDLRAMDGSFLRCLPKMVWAIFRKKSPKRGVRLHLQFDIQRGIPVSADITEALSSERKILRKRIEPGIIFLTDRGYIDYQLYQAIHDAGSFIVARLKDISTHKVLADRPLTEADRAAGVILDQEVRMGSAFTEGDLTAPVRRIVIHVEGQVNDVILLTNLLDVTAEMIGLLYRYRWQVELFFRWFKCILGCTHWLSQSRSGLTLQVYVALLASLLISLWTGRKPTKRTFEMICLYFQGWATETELIAHLETLKKREEK
jgi:hypothetical protein